MNNEIQIGPGFAGSATPTWPVAGGSLVLGFAVASVTGVRPLGGAVLLAALLWCATRWVLRSGGAITAGLCALYVGLFAVSHLLADTFGAWGSVLLVSAVMALAAWGAGDRLS